MAFDEKKYAKEYCKNYYLENKEKLLKRANLYYKNNKTKALAQRKVHRNKNVEYYKKKSHDWFQTTKGIFTGLKSRFTERDTLTFEEFRDWYDSQEKKCTYCTQSLLEIQLVPDILNKERLSIDRKDNAKGYTLENITLACLRCNAIKSNFFTFDQMLEVGKIVKERRKQLCN